MILAEQQIEVFASESLVKLAILTLLRKNSQILDDEYLFLVLWKQYSLVFNKICLKLIVILDFGLNANFMETHHLLITKKIRHKGSQIS